MTGTRKESWTTRGHRPVSTNTRSITLTAMGRERSVEARFRERVRQEREQRGMSQAELANLLGDSGFKGIYPTTIAKIESGERSVRIDEAAALADLFELSLDALLGREPGVKTTELEFQLRTLRDTARQYYHQSYAATEVLRELLDDLPANFEHSDMLQRVGRDAWANHLFETSEALINLVDLTHELIRRQQGRPELAEEALMEMDVPEE